MSGGIDVNLRYPGQRFDGETGLNYNYFRDYEASTGRYVESDPIGLEGGISTYAYVGSAPNRYSDPLGLQIIIPVPGPGRVPPPAAPGLWQPPNYGQPADTAPYPGWPGWNEFFGPMGGAMAFGTVIWDMCTDDPEEAKEKRCRALKESILNTCAGLSGRKKFRCFEAANTSYRQCMGYE